MFVSSGRLHKDRPCTVLQSQAVQDQVLWAEPALWKSPSVQSQVKPEHKRWSTLCMPAQHKIAKTYLCWKGALLWLGSFHVLILACIHMYSRVIRRVSVCSPWCIACLEELHLWTKVWFICMAHFFPVSFTASVCPQLALLPYSDRFAQ